MSYVVLLDGDKTVQSTVGINILEGWEFPYFKNPSILFKANVWDFGGQDIQYMTHHFFLTPRALYVLVADDRKQVTEFDYWFRIINLLGRESEEEKISVLVVLNEINHKSVTNFDPGKYRQGYPGMDILVCEVDFSQKDSRSDALPGKVQEMLCCLPQIGDPLPRLWVPIRQDLLELRGSLPDPVEAPSSPEYPNISISQYRQPPSHFSISLPQRRNEKRPLGQPRQLVLDAARAERNRRRHSR